MILLQVFMLSIRRVALRGVLLSTRYESRMLLLSPFFFL